MRAASDFLLEIYGATNGRSAMCRARLSAIVTMR